MLLKQLLDRPRPASDLKVFDPFRDLDHDELLDLVVGLANADIDGPRYILFGINAGAIEGNGIVGISEDKIANLKKAHREISTRIDPILPLAFIYDRINGKLVGALEIDGCDDGPYAFEPDHGDTLASDESWASEVAAPPEPIEDPEPFEPPPIAVTFSEPPDSDLLVLPIPDTSKPPSARKKHVARRGIDWKQAIKDTVGTVSARILRPAFARGYGGDAEIDDGGDDVQHDGFKGSRQGLSDADNYYFFEEKAVKFNLTVCNEGDENVEGASIEIALPRTPDFDMAERLYSRPDDDAPLKEADMVTYPEVRRSEGAIWVRNSLGLLAPNNPKPAFDCALRLAVGPGMRSKKVAISYTLRTKNNQVLGQGRLKIKFARVMSD